MKLLQNYRNKECKTWLGKYFQRLTFTWMYKIYTAIALIIIAAVTLNFTQEGTFIDNLITGLYSLGLITMIIIAAVFIAYAFIINPIKWLIKKYKK